MMKSLSLVILAATVLLNSCTLLYKPIPDLHGAPWTSLTLYYFPEGEHDWRQKWICTNATTLASLQEAYSVTNGGDLWGYGSYEYNRSVITMENGREYDLHILDPRSCVLNDYKHIHSGFGIDLKPAFFEKLKAVLETETGKPANFFAPKE